MHRLLPLFLLTALSLSSCDYDGCDPYRACTEEFRTVTIEVRDAIGGAYALDSVRTIRESNGEILRLADNHWLSPGFYPVLTDSELGMTSLEGEPFRFEGFRNGEKKVDEPYIIRNDCCHIVLKSGRMWVTVVE